MARYTWAIGIGRGRWRAAFLLAALLAYAPPAATAQIDVSGRWHFTLSDDTFGVVTDRSLRLTQSGTSLTVSPPSNYTAGTIDPLTGALHLDGSGACTDFFTLEVVTIPWSIDATASADGQTIAGTFAESIQPTRGCLPFTGSLQGERLSELCGNGALDAGEACDGGPTGTACCTEFCTAVPSGTTCAMDTVCATSACDGGGACVATPRLAGTLCRLASGPCDTPEVCDGTATTCPAPTSPTQPDVDGDGVLDPCDDCVGAPLEQSKLRIGRFTAAPDARDFVELSTVVRLPSGATLPDPASTWKLVTLRGQNSGAGFYVQVPGGAWDPVLGYGWMMRGNRWLFRSRDPVGGVVSRMSIVPLSGDPGAYQVRVSTEHAALSALAPEPPLALEVIVDGLGPSTQCGQATFAAPGGPAPACRSLSRSGLLTCR